MNVKELKNLRVGDTVRHYLSGDLWTVVSCDENGFVAVRTTAVAQGRVGDWNFVPRPRRNSTSTEVEGDAS